MAPIGMSWTGASGQFDCQYIEPEELSHQTIQDKKRHKEPAGAGSESYKSKTSLTEVALSFGAGANAYSSSPSRTSQALTTEKYDVPDMTGSSRNAWSGVL